MDLQISLWASTTLAAVVVLSPQLRAAEPNSSLPFARTEVREPCENFVATKQPFFGETHLHTSYSFDAVSIDTRNTPQDAYRYAKGGSVGLPPWADTRTETGTPSGAQTLVTAHPYCMPGEHCQFTATRTIQLPEGRALDFAAITDHAEQFGESNICEFEATQTCSDDSDCPVADGQKCISGMCRPEGYDSDTCVSAREEQTRLVVGPITNFIAGLENVPEAVSRPDFCGTDGSICTQQAKLVWDQIQQNAEEAYDRTSACTFTSFIAYEYTAMAISGRCVAMGSPFPGDVPPCWQQEDCPAGTTCQFQFPGSTGGDNLHRNVIFRNDDVIDQPISNVEIPLGCGFNSQCTNPAAGTTTTPNSPIASPAVMLQALKDECVENPLKPRCDVLTIPHNPNVSRGSMFILPDNTPDGLSEARIRNQLEPLVEISQIKGQSECRFNAKTSMAWTNPPDELCDFENMGFSRLGSAAYDYLTPQMQDLASIPPRSYVRNTLENGIKYAAQNGINPFQLGFVGALDNHNGTPGQSDAEQYAKSGAHGIQSFAVSAEALNERFFLGMETNAGGIAVAWAEENSRDSIFTALKNRETYATSGTRPIVRFFGGFDLPLKMCQRGDFVERGYLDGVPMGGCLEDHPAAGSKCKRRGGKPAPRFAVLAMKDAGWPGHPGTGLQRAQIIKGWVDKATGESREAVYDVAGHRNNGASVDLQTCKTRGEAFPQLCAVWTDPDFDPDEHAFYYARVLENPSCRWNQFYCNARGVDCGKPMGTCRSENPTFNGRGCNSNNECGGGVCTLPATYEEFEYQQCCGDVVPKTVQQRAWTSPIWYTPS